MATVNSETSAEGLKGKQIQAAIMIAQGSTCKDAAKAAGVSPQTISEWMRDPHFQACLNGLKREALECARTKMQSLAGLAIETVRDVLANAETDAIRLRAAAMVLHHIGLTDPTSGLWMWGVGPSNAHEIAQKKKSDEKWDQVIAGFMDLK